ncbi:MAG: restriction endonuclease subunit S [Agathobacter sp.]|nr:restriction endonuclease subunit S [Agathobacter sp.]
MRNPKIRFKGYADAWEQRKFGDLLNETRDKTTIEDEDTLLSCAIDGMFLNSELFSHFRGSSNIGYLKVKKNDLILSAQNLHLGNCNVNLRFEHGIISPAYKVYELVDCDPLFIQAWVKQDKTKDFFLKASTEGASVCRKNIVWEELYKQELPVPKMDEQIKIGKYFDELDNLITLHQRKCEEIKTLKKFMLQKMFPQNGENVPEIRFDGFTDAWEQRKFGDLADYKKGPFGSAITKDMFVPKSDEAIKVYEQQNAINKDWTLERYFLPKKYADSKLKSFEVHGGDIIVSCAGTIGEIYEIPESADSGVINQALMRVRVNDDVVDKNMFIIAFSNMIEAFTRTHSNGSAIKNIPPFSDLKPMEVLMPTMAEQMKISDYFTNLDNLITLHQRKCDELQSIKKFMLQNMFV